MSEKATAVARKATFPRSLPMAALALIAVALVASAWAVAPYVFKGATLEGEVATQLRTTTGLAVTAHGRVGFGLLPTPHVEIADLRLAGPDDALVVEAGTLEGEVRLLPLLVGRLELGAATLTHPKLTIDLDRGDMPPDSTIGRALHGLGPVPGGTSARLGTVTLVDGTAALKSRRMSKPPRLDEINVTIDWPDIASPATLTGSLMVDGAATDIAAWVAKPSTLMRGETSPIAVRIHAAPLELSANGDLVSAEATLFRGHMAATAPSLSALLARIGARAPHLAPLANAAVVSDTAIAVESSGETTVDLPGLALDLDSNHYEGTLSYRSGSRPSLSGTLATGTLMLAPFLASEPHLADAEHHWTTTAFAADSADAIDLDLRISANHLRIAPFTIDDAALSVMTRGARTEVALNEGKAYGGTIKGRASIGDQNGLLSLRGAGTLADADVAGLSWDALGRQVAAGTISGALNIETSGATAAELMQHLQGWAKGNAHDGEVSGLDLGRCLHEVEAKRPAAGLSALRRGRTAYTSVAFSLRVADGIATVEDGVMDGPDASATVTGTADIGRRDLDLDATASPPSGKPGGTRLAVGIQGAFETLRFTPRFIVSGKAR